MSLKVLLADDSMTAQNMAKKILADSGYEVTTVSNGAAAVKKIAEVKPDLVILDIYMPGYTGLEVCERVRANLETTNIPVLLTVGKMEPYRPEDGARVRADGIIVKPFEATDLLGIVKKISEKFAGTKKAPPAAYEPTVAVAEEEDISNAALEEFQPTQRIDIPSEMAVAPAMAFDEVPADSPAPLEVQWAPSPAEVAEELKNADAPLPIPMELSAPSAASPYSFAEVQAEAGTITDSMPVYVDQQTPAPMPEIEFNAVPAPADIAITPSADLEPTIRLDETNIEVAPPDPALVTDMDELAKFTTSFGVENAEEVPVGIVTGDEAFLAEPEKQDVPEPLSTEQVFSAPTADIELPVEPAPEAVAEEVHAEPAPASAGESLDDFEARVAAAMSAFDQPLEETASAEEPVVEQVDNFIGDPEVPNPVSVEPAEAVEAAPVQWQEPEPVVEPEPIPVPEPEPVRALDVNETMVLPAEALLSLEAEMRKAMEMKQAAASEPSGAVAEEAHVTEPEEPVAEASVSHPKDDEFTAALTAALNQVQSEPAAHPEPQHEDEVKPLAMAAAAAIPATPQFGSFGEEKLANAVQTAVERLKPQLIAEIVKALKGE